MRTPLGTSAQLKTSTAEPAQYLERDADGRFSLKVMQVAPELDVEVLLGRGNAPETVTASLSYRFVLLGKRAPVPGLSLEVGVPEIHEATGRGVESQVRGGDWCLVGLGDNTLSSGLVLLMRASRAR